MCLTGININTSTQVSCQCFPQMCAAVTVTEECWEGKLTAAGVNVYAAAPKQYKQHR